MQFFGLTITQGSCLFPLQNSLSCQCWRYKREEKQDPDPWLSGYWNCHRSDVSLWRQEIKSSKCIRLFLLRFIGHSDGIVSTNILGFCVVFPLTTHLGIFENRPRSFLIKFHSSFTHSMPRNVFILKKTLPNTPQKTNRDHYDWSVRPTPEREVFLPVLSQATTAFFVTEHWQNTTKTEHVRQFGYNMLGRQVWKRLIWIRKMR